MQEPLQILVCQVMQSPENPQSLSSGINLSMKSLQNIPKPTQLQLSQESWHPTLALLVQGCSVHLSI